jgi:hypothetical protein
MLWTDDDILDGLLPMAARLEADPLDLAGCWLNESGLDPKAHNPHGEASGINQLMPDTARGLGWMAGDERWAELASIREQLHGEHPAEGEIREQLLGRGEDIKRELMAPYRALSVREQLVWVEKYYAAYRGRLVSPSAVYLATFEPAKLAHAGDPSFVISRAGDGVYEANASLDVDHDSAITVADLTRTIEIRTSTHPAWAPFAARVRAMQSRAVTVPELPVALDEDNKPVFGLPPIDEPVRPPPEDA